MLTLYLQPAASQKLTLSLVLMVRTDQNSASEKLMRGPSKAARERRALFAKVSDRLLQDRVPDSPTCRRGSGRSRQKNIGGRRTEESDQRQRLKASWQAVQSPTDSEKRQTAAERRTRRRWRLDLLAAGVTDCETAMRDHDLGRFYRSLAELGVSASECEFSNVQCFTADEARPFWLQLAGTPILVQTAVRRMRETMK